MPVASAPHVPPTPCTPTPSSESSQPSFAFRLHTVEPSTAARPLMPRAPMGVSKPAAGVTATSPATAPEAAPSTVGLPRELHSVSIQPRAAAAAAVFVVVKAWTARPLAARALPALKPNHPNQSGLGRVRGSGRVG